MIRLTVPDVGREEIAAVTSVLRSGYLVQGTMVQQFEDAVRDYVGVEYAIAVSSGTAALHLSLIALGIGKGDEVILPDFTFPATGNVVALVGAKPVLVDIDARTYNIDTTKIEEKVTSRTKAIIPVHLFGQPADMGPISGIARQHKLCVIEDASCALGAEHHGKKCGTMGDIGCFSFHPRKAITTGEGGMLVTNDKEIAEEVRALRNHGIVSRNGKYSFEYAGFNYRMTDFQGAMGWVQMGRIDKTIEGRRKPAKLYDSLLRETKGVQIPFVADGNKHIYQSYVILLDDQINREDMIEKLKEKGIETTIGTYALHSQRFYQKKCGYKEGELENSYTVFRRSLCLPLYQGIKRGSLIHVVDSFKLLCA